MRKQEAIMKRKRRSAVLAGLLVLVMLLTGTWAFQSLNQRAFNPYVRSNLGENIGRNFGGRLHDDYQWPEDGIGPHNKDIYAENFGEEEIFVRIQLREFLALDGTPVGDDPSAISINDPSTWPIYNSYINNVTTRRPETDTALIGKKGIGWVFGGSKYFMPTFNQATHEASTYESSIRAPFNHITAYRMTNATGNAVDAIAGEFNIDEVNDVQDIIDRGVQTGPGTTAGEASVGSGGQNDWENNQPFEAPVLRVNENGHLYQTLETHTAKPTITPTPVNQNGVNVTNGVMTLTEWQRAGRPNGDFWILDTENPGGWFYWASPLQPTEATSLLLNELTINEQSADLEYIITPTVDFVTRDYIDTLPGLSEDAREIWERGLPEATAGCAQTGTPDNLWTDSTGVEWCVVADQGDYAMLVSRRAHRLPPQDGLSENQANRNHYENEFVPWPATTDVTGGPEIRGRVNTWFNNTENVSQELRNGAIHARLPNLNDTLSTDASDDRRSDSEVALSLPVEGTSDGLPFFLSPADLNVRLGNSNANRQALAPDGTTTRWYWTRSAGGFVDWNVSVINSFGIWNFTNADDASSDIHGVRPALWVRR